MGIKNPSRYVAIVLVISFILAITTWFVFCSFNNLDPTVFVSGTEYSVVKTFWVGDKLTNMPTYLTECDQYWGRVTITRGFSYGTMSITYKITTDLVIKLDDIEWHFIDYGENWIKMGHN